MNWLDVVILIVISLFAFLGLKRGLIKEIISIFAIIGGILAAVLFYPYLGEVLIKTSFIKSKSIASICGFLLIMFFTFVVINLIGYVLNKIVGTLNLNWFNRICGGFFGAIKGVIISFLIIAGLGFFLSEKDPPFKNSIFVPYIKESLSILKEIIPDEFDENLQKAKKLIQEKGIKAAIKEVEKVKETYLEKNGKEKESKK
ncbi:MAG: CvpA family protein [Thermodesulfobacteriota bacterium]